MENESQFSVSQQEQTSKNAVMENATDIKVSENRIFNKIQKHFVLNTN